MKIDEMWEEQYKRIWMQTKINAPFVFTVNFLRKKWRIKASSTSVKDYDASLVRYKEFIAFLHKQNDDYLHSEIGQFIPAITEVQRLKISDYHKSKIILHILSNAPESRFLNDIETFTTIFSFEKDWKYSLSFYIVTDKIIVPRTTSKNPRQERITDNIKLMVDIFYLDVLKRMGKPEYKDMTDLNIGQRLIGDASESASDDDLARFDKKLTNYIKKNRERFRKMGYFIPLTKERQSNLKQLFS